GGADGGNWPGIRWPGAEGPASPKPWRRPREGRGLGCERSLGMGPGGEVRNGVGEPVRPGSPGRMLPQLLGRSPFQLASAGTTDEGFLQKGYTIDTDRQDGDDR